MPIVTIIFKQTGSWPFRIQQRRDGLAVDIEKRSVQSVKQNLNWTYLAMLAHCSFFNFKDSRRMLSLGE